MSNKVITTISVKHDFNEGGTFNQFSIEPLAVTENLCKQYAIGFKHENNRVHLYIDRNQINISNPERSVIAGTKLYFWLTIKDPFWCLYTEESPFPETGFRMISNAGIDAASELAIRELESPIPADKFALLEIEITQEMLFSLSAKQLSISFQKREAYWEYFLVTNFAQDPNDFSLVDTTAELEDTQISFNRVDDADTEKMPSQSRMKDLLMSQFPESICIHYVSNEKVPCQKEGKRNIQLRHKNSILLENISPPPLNNISKFHPNDESKDQSQNAFFNVIKYVTQPFTANGS